MAAARMKKRVFEILSKARAQERQGWVCLQLGATSRWDGGYESGLGLGLHQVPPAGLAPQVPPVSPPHHSHRPKGGCPRRAARQQAPRRRPVACRLPARPPAGIGRFTSTSCAALPRWWRRRGEPPASGWRGRAWRRRRRPAATKRRSARVRPAASAARLPGRHRRVCHAHRQPPSLQLPLAGPPRAPRAGALEHAVPAVLPPSGRERQ